MTKLTVARCEFTYEVYKLPEKKLMTVGKTGHGFVNREFVPVNLKSYILKYGTKCTTFWRIKI